jgi:crossover junction endodeoxyribonuclease RuvC
LVCWHFYFIIVNSSVKFIHILFFFFYIQNSLICILIHGLTSKTKQRSRMTEPFYYIGIDVGLGGAVAVFGTDGTLDVYDMPIVEVKRNNKLKKEVSAAGLHSIIKYQKPSTCLVEQVAARPGQSVTAMFQFGRFLGQIEGVIAAHEIPISYVQPRVWQKAVELRGGDTKEASRLRAMELFPAYAEKFRRKKDHGRSDASLVAYHAFLTGVGGR